MSDQPLIRAMTVDDLDDVIAIENEVFTEAWTRESFVYEIKKKSLLSADCDGVER